MISVFFPRIFLKRPLGRTDLDALGRNPRITPCFPEKTLLGRILWNSDLTDAAQVSSHVSSQVSRHYVSQKMPSVASFMMPAAKCVTAIPEDKLSSVVTSLINEHIGCVVVVDPATEKAVGIVTKQDVNKMFLDQVSMFRGVI